MVVVAADAGGYGPTGVVVAQESFNLRRHRDKLNNTNTMRLKDRGRARQRGEERAKLKQKLNRAESA